MVDESREQRLLPLCSFAMHNKQRTTKRPLWIPKCLERVPATTTMTICLLSSVSACHGSNIYTYIYLNIYTSTCSSTDSWWHSSLFARRDVRFYCYFVDGSEMGSVFFGVWGWAQNRTKIESNWNTFYCGYYSWQSLVLCAHQISDK